MQGLYAQYETDPEIEKAGVWVELGPNTQGKEMRIRVARAGGANENYLKLLEFRSKPMRRAIQTNTADRKRLQEIIRDCSAETLVTEWENFENRAGEPLAFNVENVCTIFRDVPFVFETVQETSNTLQLYLKEIQEVDSKN